MKRERHGLIREIIENEKIETQEDLTQALLDRGLKVTQATVSRDIKQMRLFKVPDEDGHYHYVCPKVQSILNKPGRVERTLQDSLVNIRANSSLVVIHTVPGGAAQVAFLIDSLNWDEVLGTIAGDDTIFIAVSGSEAADALMQRLNAYM